MQQLFDSLNPDFFKPLAGVHRKRYADIITLIWDRCKRSPDYGESKDTLLNWNEEYFDGIDEEISFDSEDSEYSEDVGSKGSRYYATAFLRRLKETGWIEEREGGYAEETQIIINHRIIPIIKSFQDVINPKLVTYKGKLFKIYKLLMSIGESESPYESILKEVSSDLDELNSALRQLAASIGTHIDELTRGKTPVEILNLFENYEEQIVVGAYHRFKTNDNLYYYRTELATLLAQCSSQYLLSTIKDYEMVARVTESEAVIAIRDILTKIQEDLKEMGDIMRVIDESHIIYRSRAVQRAQFLLLSDGTIKGKINQILQYMTATISSPEDLFDYETGVVADILQVFPQFYFDSSSIKPPVSKRPPTPITYVDDVPQCDPEEIRRRQELLIRYIRNAVTIENVNLFASKALKSTQATTAAVLASEFSATEDIAKIIGLHTYSTSTGRNYDLVAKPEYIKQSGLRFQNFTIHKKG